MELAFIPDERFMRQALELAREAAEDGEVPVGAVVVLDGEVIGRGRNRRESSGNALAHAEIEAIAAACRKLGSWRLTGSRLYVTLEPCPMCAGAAVNARVSGIVYGADDEAMGCCGTAADVLHLPGMPGVEVYRGCMEEEARALLQSFFEGLRVR